VFAGDESTRMKNGTAPGAPTAAHVVPESSLRQTPSSLVVAYSTVGSVGSMARSQTIRGVRSVMGVHVAPPSVLFTASLFIMDA